MRKTCALVHKTKVELPDKVVAVKGDATDADSLRKALEGIDTVFVLNPVVSDELNRALLIFGLIREAGIKRVVYQSMYAGSCSAAVALLAATGAVADIKLFLRGSGGRERGSQYRSQLLAVRASLAQRIEARHR